MFHLSAYVCGNINGEENPDGLRGNSSHLQSITLWASDQEDSETARFEKVEDAQTVMRENHWDQDGKSN